MEHQTFMFVFMVMVILCSTPRRPAQIRPSSPTATDTRDAGKHGEVWAVWLLGGGGFHPYGFLVRLVFGPCGCLGIGTLQQ
jgi:hypothetical protein